MPRLDIEEVDYSAVKAGNHIGVEERGVGERFRTVLRVTPTRIILYPGGTLDRYSRKTGMQCGVSPSDQWISYWATEQEIAAYMAWVKKKDREEKRQAKLSDLRADMRRKELQDLFPVNVSVQRQGSNGEQKYMVTFGNMTESDVRYLGTRRVKTVAAPRSLPSTTVH